MFVSYAEESTIACRDCGRLIDEDEAQSYNYMRLLSLSRWEYWERTHIVCEDCLEKWLARRRLRFIYSVAVILAVGLSVAALIYFS